MASGLNLSMLGKRLTISKKPPPILSHPWSVIDASWQTGNFGVGMEKGTFVIVIRPSFVNGIDPVMQGAVGFNTGILNAGGVIASERAGLGLAQSEVYTYNNNPSFSLTPEKRQNLPLLGYPMMALNFATATQWPNASPIPTFFQNLGIAANEAPDNNGMSISFDEYGNVTVTTSPTSNTPPPTDFRVAMSVDIILGKARLMLQQNITIGTGIQISSGLIATYSSQYSTQAIDAYSLRPFIYQVPNWNDVLLKQSAFEGNSLLSLYNGTQQIDDGIDKQWLMRVWAVSPPLPISQSGKPVAVDGSWTLFFQYKAFQNLAYACKRPAIYNVPSSVGFYTGLAAGVGDAIINAYLGMQNDITDRLTQAAFNATPLGKFWSCK